MNYFKNTLHIAIVLFAGVLVFTACKKDSGMNNPTADKLDPGQGAGGEVITLTGNDLASIQSIVFEKDNVPCLFNPTLNTESAIIFRVPDTATGGQQNIILTNTAGKQLKVPFNVLAYPNVTGVSDYDFVSGTTLELYGVNLEEVNKVVIHGTTDQAAIVSKSKKKLVITMPSTTIARAKLDVSNSTGTTVTTQEFVYKPNNFVVFDDDWGAAAAYGGSIQSWSYDCNAYRSTAITGKAGAAVLQADYTKEKGGLSAFLGCSWATPNSTFSQFYKAAYLTFWARTEGSDINITIVPDNPWTGNDIWGTPTATGTKTITVVKGQWTYFKIPADFITGEYSRLDFSVPAGTTVPKTVYFDDILMVK